jgi:hypothetical protein
MVDSLKKPGFEEIRPGVKVPAKETLLTPRFYTTDFEEMARMDLSPNEDELLAILEEFRWITIVTILFGMPSLSSLGSTLTGKRANCSSSF